jgi:hypothetical protein
MITSSANRTSAAFAFHLRRRDRFALFGNVVQAQYHVLRRQGNGRAVLRVEHVVEESISTCASRMAAWLSGTCTAIWSPSKSALKAPHTSGCSWMALPSISLGLECLDGQGGAALGTVEQHRVAFQDVFQDFPDHGILAVNQFLGRFHRLYNAALDELADDKRLEQLCRHAFSEYRTRAV